MLSDLDLIKKVKDAQDSDALKELASRHTGLYVDILNKYSYLPEIEKQDILDHKEFNIYQYALDYKPERNMKFSVYVGQRLKFQCLDAISHRVDTEEVSSEIVDSPQARPDEETIRFIIGSTAEITDKRFFIIFKLRHLMDKPQSWKRIGREIGLTYEGARKIYKHNIQFVRNRLKRERLINV